MEYKKSLFFAEPTIARMRKTAAVGKETDGIRKTAAAIANEESYCIASDFFERIYRPGLPTSSRRRHFPVTDITEGIERLTSPEKLLRNALMHHEYSGGYGFRSLLDGRMRVVSYWGLARGEKLFAWEMHNGSVEAKLDDNPEHPRVQGSTLHLTVASMTDGEPRKPVSIKGVPLHKRADWRNLRGETIDCEDNMFRGLGYYDGPDWDIFCPHEVAAFWLSLVYLKKEHGLVIPASRNPLLAVSDEGAAYYNRLEFVYRAIREKGKVKRRPLNEPEKTLLMGARIKQIGIDRFFSNEGVLADRAWK